MFTAFDDTRGLADVDWGQPVNWDCPLNRGLKLWMLAGPNPTGRGTFRWRNLANPLAHGTLTNMDPKTDWVGSTRPGGFGALDFDGTDDYVDISAIDTALDGLTEATLSFRCNRTATGTKASVGRSTATASGRFGMEWHTDNKIYLTVEGAFDAYPNFTSSVLGWHHLTMVFNGALSVINRVALYFDGAPKTLVAGGFDPATSIASRTGMAIGRFSNSGTSFDYANNPMDDVRIWSRALPAGEVARIYDDSLLSYPQTLRRVHRPLSIFDMGGGGGPNQGALAYYYRQMRGAA